MAQVRDFCGHADVNTTLAIFTHVLDEDKRATTAALGKIIKRPFAENAELCSENCSESCNLQNNS